MRWLHTYLSMLGLAVTLFFALTGLTLNHPDWFRVERHTTAEGTLEPRWLAGDEVARLEVVEHLRSAHDVRGALAEFSVDDAECLIVFKGPGRSADAIVDRATGRYTLNRTEHGLVAVLNDLHKGRDSGPAWSLLIDASALLLAAISLTGLWLIFTLRLRRRPGLLVAALGTLAAWLLYRLAVP
jgi:hypothetical protein